MGYGDEESNKSKQEEGMLDDSVDDSDNDNDEDEVDS